MGRAEPAHRLPPAERRAVRVVNDYDLDQWKKRGDDLEKMKAEKSKTTRRVLPRT